MPDCFNSGQAIGHDTLRRICENYLATGKTHALRHTFAVGMMNSGAPITDLGDRLGHTDVKITQIYTRELRGADNPYGERLTARFGIHRQARR